MAIRNTSHDGPCACLTSPECNSAKILRMPNLRAVNVGDQKFPAAPNDMRMLGRERENISLYYLAHLCRKLAQSDWLILEALAPGMAVNAILTGMRRKKEAGELKPEAGNMGIRLTW